MKIYLNQNKLRKLFLALTLFFFLALLTYFFIFKTNDPLLPLPKIINQLTTENKPISFPEDKEIGIWAWDSPLTYSTDQLNKTLTFLNNEGIDTIYLNIEEVGYLLEGTQDEKKQADLAEFNQTVNKFLITASEHNINVQAMAGGTDWANPSHKYFTLLLTDYVLKFNANANNPQKFEGIHFDIEFYNQDNFEKDKQKYAVYFFDLVEEINNLLKSNSNAANLKLAFDIPFWFDNPKANVPEITWKGKRDNALVHMVDILKTRNNNSLVLMSYRNYTNRSDGVIEISKDEIEYTTKNAPNVSIYVGFETAENEIRKVTFYEMSKKDVKKASQEVYEAFKTYSTFRGFALHQLNSYQELN